MDLPFQEKQNFIFMSVNFWFTLNTSEMEQSSGAIQTITPTVSGMIG